MSNIQHLRDIITGFDIVDTEEALEFLDSIEDEREVADSRIKELENDVKELESDAGDEDFKNEDFVGLDTISWSLKNGNLKIQSQIETFIAALKKQNSAGILLY